MNKALISAVSHTPKVYETSTHAFWDDDHISKSMLENHLAPDSAGATRKHEHVKVSVDWLATLPTPGNKLLDLGCGPGIYAELLAQRGYAVTGVDLSRRSIEYAQQSATQKGLDITYLCKDYLSLELAAESFSSAILIYCDYGVLAPADRTKLLQTVYDALEPGGLLVLDVFSPTNYADWENNTEVSYEESGFWSDKPHVIITINKEYPDAHYLERYTIVTEDDCRSYNIWNHAFTAAELTKELQNAGFAEVELFSDATGAAFAEESKTICVVAKKK